MNNEKITLMVIDDHPLFRKGVADLISMDSSLTILAEADSGEQGFELARALSPDLILLDLNMKGMDGIDTLKEIKKANLDSRVIMLTVSDQEDNIITALRAGADGYLLKDMEPEDILQRLRQAADGRLVISDKLTELLARALCKDSQPRDPDKVELTEREREILELVSQGMSNKLIARQLDISEGTVKVHVKHLLKKLNLHSRVEAAVWTIKNSSPKQ